MSLMHSSIRLVTTPRATTGTIPALRARGWGVVWSGHVPDFHFSRGWQDGGGLRSCGKVLVKHVPATYRASRNWRQHLDSTPWTGRGDKFHHTVSDTWCLDVNSLSTDVYPFVFDNARVNRSAETSPNLTPLSKRSLNPRAFYFSTRTEQISSYLSFNFQVQFTNKNVGSLWWSLKTTRQLCSRRFEVGRDKERACEEICVSL